MKTYKFNNEDAWLEARLMKITGTRLKDIVTKRGTKDKIGFYELIAERLTIAGEKEMPMSRGRRLEKEAIARFAEETRKDIDDSLVLWTRDDEENIASSPDGVIGEKEAIEIKCLSSARHIETYLAKQVPEEYEMQVIQYFIVNDKLEKLYFVLYDPRFVVSKLQLFTIEVTRAELAEKIQMYHEHQIVTLARVNEIVKALSF